MKLRETSTQPRIFEGSKYEHPWYAYLKRPKPPSSEAVAKSALLREESRGAHTREDFPDERKERLEYNIINKKGKDGEMETLKEKRNEPDAELNRIANSSIEDLEKEVKKDHNKLMSEV